MVCKHRIFNLYLFNLYLFIHLIFIHWILSTNQIMSLFRILPFRSLRKASVSANDYIVIKDLIIELMAAWNRKCRFLAGSRAAFYGENIRIASWRISRNLSVMVGKAFVEFKRHRTEKDLARGTKEKAGKVGKVIWKDFISQTKPWVLPYLIDFTLIWLWE